MAVPKKVFDISVDQNVCKACGYCQEMCKFDVFDSSNELNTHGYRYMVAAHKERCVGCLRCFTVCPDCAITVKEIL